MMHGDENKVVSLFDRAKDRRASQSDLDELDPNFSFEDSVKRNQENLDRLKKERTKANKNLVRNFRLGQKR